MDKQAVIRRVRIAVSVFFGVLTVALCVLWVRSYWRYDFVLRADKPNTQMRIHTLSGIGQAQWTDFAMGVPRRVAVGWHMGSIPLPPNVSAPPSIELFRSPQASRLSAPIWALAVFSSCVAAVPWLSYRFSLRTMLIVTTLVAVALGLARARRLRLSRWAIENAQAIAAHESPRTTKLYDRTSDEVTLDEIEKIVI